MWHVSMTIGSRRSPGSCVLHFFNIKRDTTHLSCLLLRLGDQGCQKGAERESDREPDQPHEHLGWARLPGSLAERHDAHQGGRREYGARAFSLAESTRGNRLSFCGIRAE